MLGRLMCPLRALACAGRSNTIQHWQLRDLVHCPDKDEEIYCVHRHRTLRYDVRKDRVRTRISRIRSVPSLSFSRFKPVQMLAQLYPREISIRLARTMFFVWLATLCAGLYACFLLFFACRVDS